VTHILIVKNTFVCRCVLQLDQYKVVSQSFEKRVLDLQKEVKSKDDEIAVLQKANSSFQNSANHARIDGQYQSVLQAWVKYFMLEIHHISFLTRADSYFCNCGHVWYLVEATIFQSFVKYSIR